MKDKQLQEKHILEKNTRLTSDRSVLSRFVLGLYKQTHSQNLVKGALWLSAVVHLVIILIRMTQVESNNFCCSCERQGVRLLVHLVEYLAPSNNQDFFEDVSRITSDEIKVSSNKRHKVFPDNSTVYELTKCLA